MRKRRISWSTSFRRRRGKRKEKKLSTVEAGKVFSSDGKTVFVGRCSGQFRKC